MHYEPFLFTRNQRQDFTVFIRPALLTNKEVSAIGGIFNYVSDISRLTADAPSLYYFPLGDYLLLLRHYNSGRTHAGRAIAVIEGIAIHKSASGLALALPEFVDQQADLLCVPVEDIETLQPQAAAAQDWHGLPAERPPLPFATEFLQRRAQDRLFLPFSAQGRDLLAALLADQRLPAPPFFAFGTNSDVLAQIEHYAIVDVVSFFKTDHPTFRSRVTNRVTGVIDGYGSISVPDPSMSLRAARHDEISVRHRPTPIEDDEDTVYGVDAVSIRSSIAEQTELPDVPLDDDDSETEVLTIRQMRDKIRAEQAAAHPAQSEPPRALDPLHWLIKLVSSLISPHKPN